MSSPKIYYTFLEAGIRQYHMDAIMWYVNNWPGLQDYFVQDGEVNVVVIRNLFTSRSPNFCVPPKMKHTINFVQVKINGDDYGFDINLEEFNNYLRNKNFNNRLNNIVNS